MEGGPTPDDSIPSLVSRLVDDGKQFARAEVKLQLARWSPRFGNLRNAAILAGIALTLAPAVLTALFVGLILVLLGPLGPGGATAVVVIAGLLVIAVLGWLAVGQVKRVFGDHKDSG